MDVSFHRTTASNIAQRVENEISQVPQYDEMRLLSTIDKCFRDIKVVHPSVFECFDYDTQSFDYEKITSIDRKSHAATVEEQRILARLINIEVSSVIYEPLFRRPDTVFAETLIQIRDEKAEIEKYNIEMIMLEEPQTPVPETFIRRINRAGDLLEGGRAFYKYHLSGQVSWSYQYIYQREGRTPRDVIDGLHTYYRRFLEEEYNPNMELDVAMYKFVLDEESMRRPN